MRALDTAATGMLAQQLNVEVISNNIANVNTTGYKRQRVEFNDLLYQDQRRVGTQSAQEGNVVPSGIQVGLGVKPGATYRIHEQGSLEITDNPLDLAINGEGFFQITLPNGETAYTRTGSFQLSPDGHLVTSDGFTVEPGINIPEDAVGVTVNPDGEVLVDIDGQVAPQNVGQLELARFSNPAGLEAMGDNLFSETQASGAPLNAAPNSPGFGSIQQGAVENSNVEIVKEITNMIDAQRAYEMNSRVIKASDEMMRTTSQLR
jgi:flagellar basal-body rod protein FlgG